VSRTTSKHYSYTVYADPLTAESFDERRFGGPIGQLVADDQARVLTRFLGKPQGLSVLDVGTGTGRAAVLLAREGARVTGVDSSEPMLAVARQRAASEHLAITFVGGDAHHLEFAPRSFDAVVSLRVLMHTVDWRESVAELCRVADRLVIIDFPATMSFAALQSCVRRVGFGVGLRTEPYRVLREGAVSRELGQAGFRVREAHRHFFLPIAMHKAIGSPQITSSVEGVARSIGLVRWFGTPVTLVAERCES
jgi:SAM-dependent methyltransferase